MPISALAGLVFGVAVLSIGLYHMTIVGPKLRGLSRTLAGEGDASDADSLAILRNAFGAASRRTDDRLDAVERILQRDLHRVGFVRYNSFSDVGSDLSFTLALVNDDGDGVVLTSIYSREETRTYGKAVRKFVPQQGASKEEQSAIHTVIAVSAFVASQKIVKVRVPHERSRLPPMLNANIAANRTLNRVRDDDKRPCQDRPYIWERPRGT